MNLASSRGLLSMLYTLVHNARVQEIADDLRDFVTVRLEGEVAGVEEAHVSVIDQVFGSTASGMARSVRFGIGANGVSRFFPNGLDFDASSRGASACATSVRLFHLAQPLSVFPRRFAELPAIFTTKLRRAFVAHGETDRNEHV